MYALLVEDFEVVLYLDHSYNSHIGIKEGLASNLACSEQLVTALKMGPMLELW